MKDLWAGLKDAPLWLLGGATAVALSIWLIDALNLLLPIAYQPLAPLAAFTFATLALARSISLLIASRHAALERGRERAGLRLARVYRPLIVLFAEQHLTAATGTLAPRRRDRFKNAWEAFASRRRIKAKLKSAWRALRDRRESTSAEMDFGGSFPLDEVKDIAFAGQEHADADLINLIRRADRSRYEELPSNGMITKDEYALAEHIFTQHDSLVCFVER